MKECVKDLSKNLMNPNSQDYKTGGIIMNNRKDSPYPYSESRGKSFTCRDVCGVVMVILVFFIVVWLSALTVLYQFHLTQMRSELEDLKANVISLQANLTAYRNEYYPVDEEEEQGYNLDTVEADDRTQVYNYDQLTVLKNKEDIGDDEDLEDVDDDGGYESSGENMYWDYDGGATKPSEETHIKENNLGKILKNKPQDDENKEPSKFSQLKKIWQESKEKQYDAGRLRRDVDDLEIEPTRRTIFDRTVEDFITPKMYRPRRRMQNRQYSLTGESDPALYEANRLQQQQEKPRTFVAAHFGGNTTHLDPETHPNHIGNGHLRTGHEDVHNMWSPSRWTSVAENPTVPTMTHTGHAKIHDSGIYFVYAQIYYVDEHDVSGWVIYKENPDSGDTKIPLIQCSTSSVTPRQIAREKPNSCYSAAAIHLQAGDSIAVRNMAGERIAVMHPEKSFFGLIKLAESPNGAYLFQT